MKLPRGVFRCVAALLLNIAPAHVRANQIGEETSIGTVNTNAGFNANYISDHVEIELALSNAWLLSGAAIVTHYEPAGAFQISDILHFGLGCGWQPSEQFELDLDGYVSPPSTMLEANFADPTVLRTDNVSFGGELSAVYATPGASEPQLSFDGSFGATHYAAGESVVSGEPAGFYENSQLLRLHGSATIKASFGKLTSLEVAGAYYGYVSDSVDADGQRVTIADGVLLEPTRYTLSAELTHKLGDFYLAGHLRYASYIAQEGFSWSGGLKLHWALDTTVGVAVAAERQSALFSNGERWDVYAATFSAIFDF
jgi:hypothetical protein